MIQGNTVSALIPARAGSKGIPGKNTRSIAGRSLVEWAIQAAHECSLVDEVWVTTDDATVKALCRGLDVRLIDRPHEFAGDGATASQVLQHAFTSGLDADIVVYLQPTSPLRNFEDVSKALSLLLDSGAEGVVSVRESREAPELLWRQAENGDLAPLLKGPQRNRGDFGKWFVLNGAIYAAWSRSLSAHGDFSRIRLRPYIMPQERSIDIDDMGDLRAAEAELNKDVGKSKSQPHR